MKRLTWLALIMSLSVVVGCPGDSSDGDGDSSDSDGSAGSGGDSSEPARDADSSESDSSTDDAEAAQSTDDASSDSSDMSDTADAMDMDTADAMDSTDSSDAGDCDSVPAALTACLGNIADGCWDPDMSGTCEQSATREVTWSDGHRTVNLGGTPGLYAPGDADGSPCITSEFDSRTYAVTNTNTMNGAVVVNLDNGDGTITFTCTDGSEQTFTNAEAELSNVCRGVQCEVVGGDSGGASGSAGNAGGTCTSTSDCGDGSLCCDLGAIATCIPDTGLGCIGGSELP